MGTRGPAPKRSEAKAGHPTEANPRKPSKVRMRGAVKVPDPRPEWRDEVVQWYQSLATSGETRFWEPSDWQHALIVGDMLEDWYGDQTATKASNVLKGMADLGTTETARRRSGIEVEREAEEDDSAAEALAELHVLRGDG